MHKRMNQTMEHGRFSSTRKALVRAAALAALTAAVAPAQGADLYWDGDGVGTVGGGSGYWNPTTARWSTTPGGSTYGLWNNGDTAVFGGAGGFVFINGAGMSGTWKFLSDYVLMNSAQTNQFTFNAASTVDVATGVRAQLQGIASLSSGATLTKTGGGALFLSYSLGVPVAPSTTLPTNNLVINGGTVAFVRHALGLTTNPYGTGNATTNSVLGINTSVTIGANGYLNLGKFNEQVGTLSGSGTVVLGSTNDQFGVWNAPVLAYGSTFRISHTSTFAGSIVTDSEYNASKARYSGGRVVIGRESVAADSVQVTLSGINTYKGVTWITNGGTLNVSGGSAIPDDSPVAISSGAAGGQLRLLANEKIGSLGVVQRNAAGAASAGAAWVNPNGFELTIGGDNHDNDFIAMGTDAGITGFGEIGGGFLYGSDAGGKIIKEGTGHQFMSIGADAGSLTAYTSSYTGNYEMKGGRLSFNSNNATGNPTSPRADYFILNGGTLGLHGFYTQALNGVVTTPSSKGITVTAAGGGLYTGVNSVVGGAGSLAAVSSGWVIQSPIVGTGTLSRTGSGSMIFQGNNSGFSGPWDIKDGATSMGSGFGTEVGLGNKVAGTGSINLSQSVLNLTTDTISGTTNQTYSIASGAGAKLSVGPGAALGLDKNGNQSLAVTAGAFERKSRGTLLVGAASGAANLGTATGEKLIFTGGMGSVSVNGGANTVVPGVLATSYSPTLAVAPVATTTEGFFTQYDPAAGLKIATMSAKTDIDAVDNTDLFEASTTSTNLVMSDNRSVYGVKVGSAAGAAILNLNGKTLSVGSGSDPATVIVSTGSSFSGAGTIDFGGREGIIYNQNGSGNVAATLSGSNGITKMGYGILGITIPANYTGKTTISQGKIAVASGSTNLLPPTTDLVFAGVARELTSNPELSLSAATVTVNSINTENRSSALGLSAFNEGGAPQIFLGTGGKLIIHGDSTTTSSFSGRIYANATTNAAVIVDNGATFYLGVGSHGNYKDVSTPNGYQQLVISGGSTVVVDAAGAGEGNSIGSLPSNGTVQKDDSVILDGGTLKIVGEPLNTSSAGSGSAVANTINAIGGGDSNAVPHSINLNFRIGRGYTFGPNGGTISVDSPYTKANLTSTSVNGGAINVATAGGSATLTKTGAGILQLRNSTAAVLMNGTIRPNILEGMVTVLDDFSLGIPATVLDPAAITLNGGILGSSVDTSPTATASLSVNRGISVGPNGGVLAQQRQAFVINGPLSDAVAGSPGALRISSSNVANASTFGGSSDGTVVGTPRAFTGEVTIASGHLIWVTAKNALGLGTIKNDPAFNGGFGTPSAANIVLDNAFQIVKGDGANRDGKFDFIVNNASGTLTLNGKISGDGQIFKSLNVSRTGLGALIGGGALELTNSTSDFTGDFTSTNGLLVVAANNALGATSGKTTIAGGTIGFKGGINYSTLEPLHVGGNIRNIAGANTFAGPVTLLRGVTTNVEADSLTLSGAVGGAADALLTKTGAGTLVLTGNKTYTGGTTVSAGAVIANKLSNGTLNIVVGTPTQLNSVQLTAKSAVNDPSGTTKVPALILGAGSATLDLTNNAFAEDYTGPSTYAGVLAAVAAGYNGGSWNGASGSAGVILSSSAAAQALTSVKTSLIVLEATDRYTTPTLHFGESIDATSVVIEYGLAGDATIDGKVTTLDFNMLAGSFGGAGTWKNGDFNYDGTVGSVDFTILAGNYGNVMPVAAPALGAVVPEPSGLALVGAGLAGLLHRRARRTGRTN